jgi:hypothetical protein
MASVSLTETSLSPRVKPVVQRAGRAAAYEREALSRARSRAAAAVPGRPPAGRTDRPEAVDDALPRPGSRWGRRCWSSTGRGGRTAGAVHRHGGQAGRRVTDQEAREDGFGRATEVLLPLRDYYPGLQADDEIVLVRVALDTD